MQLRDPLAAAKRSDLRENNPPQPVLSSEIHVTFMGEIPTCEAF